MNITSKLKVLGLAIVAVGSIFASGSANAQFAGGGPLSGGGRGPGFHGEGRGPGGGGGFGGGSSAQYQYCAVENTRCNVTGYIEVIYGADPRWSQPRTFNSTNGFDCNNATFGDPASGVQKNCWWRPAVITPPPSGPGRPPGGPGGPPGGPGSRDVIRVQSATYGANVRAGYNNAWNDVAQQCNGLMECSYQVSVRRLGDPAPGQAKDYTVDYVCGRGGRVQRAYLRPEANGQSVLLRCR